ncbi:hypothetical protein HCU62_07875 [Dissulfurirhabdus thermomarina]|nr:hypothetical protein [Dissulfurirhabdus thermomarina]
MCTRCGAVEEFFEPRLEACQEDVTRRYAFLPFRHRLVIYGLCRRCAAGLAAGTLPLHEAACGEKVRVVGFAGGANVQGRLAAMGLSVGDEVEVVNNAGPVIVSRGGVRLAVGLGLAEKVHVAPARPEVPRGSGAGTGQGG